MDRIYLHEDWGGDSARSQKASSTQTFAGAAERSGAEGVGSGGGAKVGSSHACIIS